MRCSIVMAWWSAAAGCVVVLREPSYPWARILSAHALFNLSKLAVWWLRLGIGIERIKPGHPQQNGRHERMHLTLKKEATKPACRNFPLLRVLLYEKSEGGETRFPNSSQIETPFFSSLLVDSATGLLQASLGNWPVNQNAARKDSHPLRFPPQCAILHF